ncbi:probetacellulin [Austrofundulus limnaeus]|uniref:Probetacellulin n=1 Tax=Austrofundulus limnaeus TaxID=52670 RepID=A0A2I4B2K8_AUSLI|nr:PREDICTED: probetacellulin-like [Austrofundulus limnaeus]
MVKVYRLYVEILAALALSKYCLAEGNATDVSTGRTPLHCHLHGHRDNCTAKAETQTTTTTTDPWSGHFSICPEELKHYCIHGECRYVQEQNTPSCRCHSNYFGSRCEYLDWEAQKGHKRRILIGCIIAGLVVLTALVMSICIYSHRRYRRCCQKQREEPRNGTEKLSMMDTRAVHTTSAEDSAELTHTNSV